jgi:Resolvase, N terminal domain
MGHGMARRNPKWPAGRTFGQVLPMAVYGYVRVSTQAQTDEGVSLAVQRRQLEGWAMMMGRVLDRVFVEGGVSGSVPLQERPEGERMWTGLKRGDAIVAVKLDRVFRSALDAPTPCKAWKICAIWACRCFCSTSAAT